MRTSSARPSTKANRVLPQLEMLEDRLVPAIPSATGVPLALTDMTAVAQLFPPHSGPTMLYLNFDGDSSQGISPFQSTTGDLTRDMQEIMYRVEEIFAPFNVQVRRYYGDGKYDNSSNGNTTIFIGDDISNGTGTANTAQSSTPMKYTDHPGQIKGITHQPNSDPYDLAYVDPIYYSGGSTVSKDNVKIARNIAHEAGHTFGLAHVLSAPDEDVMSYNSKNVQFVNKTFDITDLNGTPATPAPSHLPEWYVHYEIAGGLGYDLPVTITTQNSFTYLQAVLGARSTAGDFANVADATAVDPSYVDGSLTNIQVGADVPASLQQTGDYDVYNLSAPGVAQLITVDVKQATGSSVDPVVMVYSSDGQTLLYFNDDGGSYPNSRIRFVAFPGESYKVVVGGFDNYSSGGYELTVSGPATQSAGFPSAALTSTQLSASALSTTAQPDSASRNLGVTSALLPGSDSPSAPRSNLTGLTDAALAGVRGTPDLSAALDQVFASGLGLALHGDFGDFD
jgi:hypothetical protein